MTVGIALTNGKEAIVIADSRSTSATGGRQSDSAEKVLEFRHDTYHGFLLEAGHGNLTSGVFSKVRGVSYTFLEELVAAVSENQKNTIDKIDAEYIATNKREIEKKAMAISDEEARTQYMHQELERMLKAFGERKKEEPLFNSCLASVCFDKKADKVRQFWINENAVSELYMPYVLLGSGTDGAHFYFTARLQGINPALLRCEDLSFHAVNAYSFATLNAGVGGTPLVGIITKEESKIVDAERAIAATNISGAYLAEGHPGLTNNQARMYIDAVLRGENPHYSLIAKKLGINDETLRTLVIPYSSWQERANRVFFKEQKRS